MINASQAIRLRCAPSVIAAVLLLSAMAPAGATAQAGLDFDYFRENIEPIFIRSRSDFLPPDPGDPACVMCHTWQTNTPLKLQSLEEDANGGVFWPQEQSRLNFEVVSRLVTPGDPENSRLLRKPLRVQAGGTVNHTGGKYWTSTDDAEWQVIADWVRAAAGSPSAAPDPPELDFEFFEACVQPIFINPLPGSLTCIACHSSGGETFVRSIPEGQDYWSEAQSRENFELASRLIDPGYPTQSRLLMHPLHPDGGGDYAHNGVRRWRSQDDPEWQMLASWVRGERTGNSCQR